MQDAAKGASTIRNVHGYWHLYDPEMSDVNFKTRRRPVHLCRAWLEVWDARIYVPVSDFGV
jgi:hypothetical protein